MFNEQALKDWIQYVSERPDEFLAYSLFFHGITHWRDVEAFELMLANEFLSADTAVIRSPTADVKTSRLGSPETGISRSGD